MKLLLSSFLLVALFFFIHCTTTSAQSPAQAPSLPGPTTPALPGATDIITILQKAGQYTTLIRLLQSTRVGYQINTQLSSTGQGLTLFAPTDNAFANLKTGALNSFTDEQKIQLLQFHLIPSFISFSQFQTVSNPLRTQAGNSVYGQFPLNVVTAGNQTQVNITLATGIVNASMVHTIYSDKQLAVYQVDQVLLPMKFFVTPSPAPAPAPPKPKKEAPTTKPAATVSSPVDSSATICQNNHAVKMIVAIASVFASFALCP